MPPITGYHRAVARVGFSGIGRSTPMVEKMVAGQSPSAGSRPVPIGPRFIAVSLQPAIPRRVAPQQSPLPLHQSPIILAQSRSGEAIKCAAQLPQGCSSRLCPSFGPGAVSRSPCPPTTRASSLLCAPGVISILRRQNRNARPAEKPLHIETRPSRVHVADEVFGVVACNIGAIVPSTRRRIV